MGGDHSITLPLLRAHAKKFGPIALIQVDAHTDTWPDDDPSRIDHGTFCYTAVREGLIDTDRSAHVGIRTVVEDNLGIAIHDAREVHATGRKPSRGRCASGRGTHPHICRSISTGLTRPFAPGTGTTGLGGGLSSAQAAVFLRELGRHQTLSAATWSRSRPPSIRQGSRRLPGPMFLFDQICLWGWMRRGNAAVDIS